MIVTVENLKAHLNVTTDADDALLADKIAAAEASVENFTGTKFADLDPVPEPLKEAVRQLAAHLYENREAVLVGIEAQPLPFSVFDLVGPYRTWTF